MTSCQISAEARQQVRQQYGNRLELHFWAITELDEKVKKYPDILSEFFIETDRHLITSGDVLDELLKGIQQQYALYLPTSSEGTPIQAQLKSDLDRNF